MSAIAATGCLLAGFSAPILAQNNSGLTIFSGVERPNQLGYYLDFGGNRDQRDRYRLRVPSDKMELGVKTFAISYPDYYDGKFDVDSVEVVAEGQSIPIDEVVWNKPDRVLLIYLADPIEAGKSVELVLSNVRNPRWGGTYYFEGRAAAPGDVPLPRYLGTWIVSIQ
ncbi:DUF2808 domain-containing protein [Oscillatoria sp. FACHB-1406]|uniref:DUF2808 domain-containing protein n=1 Tax=Oscillatoria sp. FACHB-1406 TaxID=2692846 RepID=UPI00321FED5A